MIFSHTHTQVLDGTKTQARRIVESGDTLVEVLGAVRSYSPSYPNGRIKWQEGKTYAVQPGRGQKEVRRIRITAIRRERLQDISEYDAGEEGMPGPSFNHPFTFAAVFADLWDSIHTKPGTRWEDSPDVWVLEFELVE